jgi:flavin reductase (DIM6/NTAB) family NADH-FMN oxidoreductase RutF
MSKELIIPPRAKKVLEILPPFPVVLVTTRSNIITIGQIEYFTFSPLRIGIAVAHSRHTYPLLIEEREFVVNVPDAKLIHAVKICGSVSGRNHDKFDVAGLTPETSTEVQAVSIRECGAHIECRVSRELAFESRTWFIGEVVAARKSTAYRSSEALLCGRTEYTIPGAVIAPR